MSQESKNILSITIHLNVYIQKNMYLHLLKNIASILIIVLCSCFMAHSQDKKVRELVAKGQWNPHSATFSMVRNSSEALLVKNRKIPFISPSKDESTVFPLNRKPHIAAVNGVFREPSVSHIDEFTFFSRNRNEVGAL